MFGLRLVTLVDLGSYNILQELFKHMHIHVHDAHDMIFRFLDSVLEQLHDKMESKDMQSVLQSTLNFVIW